MKTIFALLFSLVTMTSYATTDTTTIDYTISQVYDIISGPAGERDWDAFRQCFMSNSMMGAIVPAAGGTEQFYAFSPEQYITNNNPFLSKNDFFEKELGRKVIQFGSVAQVASAYEYRFSKDGKVEKRGINFFQLVRTNGRWKITNLTWQEETENYELDMSIF